MNAARTLHLSVVTALLSLGAAQVHATEYGTVVSSTPVLGQSAVPERNCYDEQVTVAPRPSGGGAVVGALIGGVVGNSVGAGMGRAAATAVGAVAGAAIGSQAEANAAVPATTTVQRCRSATRYEDRIIGYDVVYDFNGNRRTARLAQDPGGPGTRIALEVNVAPSGAPARAGRSGAVPPPPTSQRRYDEGRVDEVYDEPPRVVREVYYAPPPVYYVPAPAYYYGAPTIWIGGGWGYHHGRRW